MQIGTLDRVSAVAGVVLAGGRSTRMGRPKASLEWHGSTLLHRVTGIVSRAVDGPVVVVRAALAHGSALPKAHHAVVGGHDLVHLWMVESSHALHSERE